MLPQRGPKTTQCSHYCGQFFRLCLWDGPGEWEKILQHENGDKYVAKEYFVSNYPRLFSMYFCTTPPNFAPFTYDWMQHISQCSIFANQQLNASDLHKFRTHKFEPSSSSSTPGVKKPRQSGRHLLVLVSAVNIVAGPEREMAIPRFLCFVKSRLFLSHMCHWEAVKHRQKTHHRTADLYQVDVSCRATEIGRERERERE